MPLDICAAYGVDKALLLKLSGPQDYPEGGGGGFLPHDLGCVWRGGAVQTALVPAFVAPSS